ncbi:MAG: choice-of-anchor D domain-containing protein, partial [Flavobacterium sp.]|uniref:choice-of-anchor D domain-containing protein n=1 Tax=Flavobacterium sp. TaxID=239 RepID=UPI002631AC39
MKQITQMFKKSIPFLSFMILLLMANSSYSQVLEVRGNNVVIPDGTTATSTTNFTDFGTVPSGNNFSRSFVLKNTGSSSLVFSGSKVALSNTTDFSITTNVIVSSNTLTANTYLIIEISYNPTATSGSQTSTVTIKSNSTGGSTSTYTFNIMGTASAAVISDFTRTTLTPTFSYPYALIYGPDDYLW